MQEATVPLLTTWMNFYVIIGAAAASLTGLMFVVLTLIVGTRQQATSETSAAFATPTVVHFCSALLIAAILSAPWQALWNVALLLGLTGLGGVTYIVIIVRRMRHQTSYKPVMEDWIWHVMLPLAAYIALIIAAMVLPGNPAPILFVIGAATVLLLFIGTHNSWDTVTYVALGNIQSENKSQD